MEAETIDLTDPFEQLVRQTGRTPEYLQGRIQRLSEENSKEASTKTLSIRNFTLNDLLGDFGCSNRNTKNVDITETIELSDDEVSEVTDIVTNRKDSGVQEITEVKVIEIRDDEDDYNSDYNEDDDDDFFEESTADVLHSSNENFEHNNPELEEHINKNSNLNKNSSVHSVNSPGSREDTEEINYESSENFDKVENLAEKDIHILTETNVERTCISTDVNTKKSPLENNCNKIILTNYPNSNMSTKMNNLPLKNKEQQIQDDNDCQLINDKESHSSDNTQKNSENSLNLTNTNKSCKSLSCDSNTSSESFRSAVSEVATHTNVCENNINISSDLGFVVSEVQSVVNLPDTFTTTTVVIKETGTNFENKLIPTKTNSITEESDSLPKLNKDIISDKLLDSDAEKQITEDVIKVNVGQDSTVATFNVPQKMVDASEAIIKTESTNKSSYKKCENSESEKSKHDIKSIRKSIDEIIEQLDKACQEEPTLKQKEKPSQSGTNDMTQVLSQKVEIDSSTRLLLKSLDEAIETCDQNNLGRKIIIEDKAEMSRNESGSDSPSLLKDSNQSELDKCKDVAFLSTDNQKFTINTDFLINKDNCNINKNNQVSSLTTPNSSSNYNIADNVPCEHSAEVDKMEDTNLSDKVVTKICNNINENHLKSSVNTSNCNDEQTTNYLKTSINNKTEINTSLTDFDEAMEPNIDKSKNLAHTLCSLVGNRSTKNSGHSLPSSIFESLTETNSTTNRKEIKNKTHHLTDDINNYNLNEKTDKIVDWEIQDNTAKVSTISVNVNATVNEKFKNNLDDDVENSEGNFLNRNIHTNNSEAQAYCPNSINIISEKIIPSSSQNKRSVGKDISPADVNLVETRKFGEKLENPTKDDSEDDNIEKENGQENFEEIRKNLKLQLTSLRNKKRMDILQDVKTKVNNIEFSKSSLLFDSVSQESNFIRPLDASKKSSSINDPNKNLIGNLQPINLDSVSIINYPVEPSNSELAAETPEEEDIPNVFKEIRKIIRKQKATPKMSVVKPFSKSETVKSSSNESQENDKTDNKKGEDKDTGIFSTTIESKKDLQILTTNKPEDKKTLADNVVNSPFVSNTLDEFLTDAKLNVSYTIPKCGAEEGLRQNYSDEPVMPPVIAEIKDEDSEKPTQEMKYKPKTLAEKRRLLEKTKLKEKKQLEKIRKLEEAQKRSYVLYKDKKIFVKTKSMGRCIASIESSKPVPIDGSSQQTTPKKPSLLTELYKKTTSPVKYMPGPLCKKHLLQIDYSNWTSELQPLPKVILKVRPQVGKPIHPNFLHILPQWDGEVNDEQIEFALSALVTKKETKHNRIFEFNVPYNNQQTHILTRKKILDKPAITLDSLATTQDCSSSSAEDVAQVIEKLLQYVEIKEIEPTLIKYDKDSTVSDESPLGAEVPTQDNHVLVKRKSRFSRTDRELLRLNCKVVSVEVEENEPERKCFKLHCRLGCICKSLQCERIIGLHCQKVKCMFGCTCPKEKDKIISIAEPTIKLPAGTDLLSTDTVTRIEGEAKRNLAKVEKEFTQTVILTNDKTIVVGFGNKPRRATKAPKKYTDFFDDETPKGENKEPKKEKTVPIRECTVDLKNWNFSEILPYCLVHHLYQCHCRGHCRLPKILTEGCKKGTGELLKLKKEEILMPSENSSNISLNKIDSKKQCPKRTVEESFQAIVRKSADFGQNTNDEDDFEETLYSVTGRPLRKRKKIYEADFVFDVNNVSYSHKSSEIEKQSVDKTPAYSICEPVDCSRTSKISQKYYQKIRSFSNAALYNDFANNLTQADLLRAMQLKNENDLSDSDLLKITIIEERKKLLKDTEEEIHKTKRKQKLQVRKDDDVTIKEPVKLVSKPKRERKGKVKSVFKGEIIVDDSEWLKKFGQNSKQTLEGYARILPWSALLNGFLSKSINIYCISDLPLRLLLNVGLKLRGEKLLDVETFGHKILAAPLKAKTSWLISQCENVREIIKWLLSGTLPSRYKTNSLSFLLVETARDQFEVRGLCTQGENKQDVKEDLTHLPTEGEGELLDQVTEVKHMNMNKEIESLFISKGKFRLRELVEDGCEDDHTDNLYMWVGLPDVYKVAKWRVIFLNNDFAFLYFKHINYSIKYTDLVKLAEMAKEEMLTLVLRNVQIRRSYDHASFGIYISHNYIDRLFIGPYFTSYDEDEVETLRYINQQLVSSEAYNKMTGNPNYRCGHWMFERTYYHTPTVYMKDTIDLTNDDTPSKPLKSLLKQSSQTSNSSVSISPTTTASSISTLQLLQSSAKDEHIIYHSGMSIRIKNSKPRTPSEFNRFIITNIPHFGYLGAYQPDNSSVLEVSWPFEKKVLQFENADNARDFLQERFNQLLQPVPESFKIQVIVLIQLDLTEHQPINSDFLSGHCICGYFGTYNFRELSDEFCKEKLNISKEEITKLFAKRAHAYIKKKIEELAEIVGVSQNDPENFNVPSILHKAEEEIKLQENTRRQQISEIQAYEIKAASRTKKLREIINKLSTKERNIELKIINEILTIRPRHLATNEVVEIKDDDDDKQIQTKTNPVMYNIESDDTNPEKPTKKPLKRKRSSKKNAQNPKVAKVASLTSGPYVGPSTSELTLEQPETDLKVNTNVKNVYKGRKSIVIVLPHQSPLEITDKETVTINGDTETITINEDKKGTNQDIETVIINEDTEAVTFNEDIETVTINEDTEAVTFNEDVETVTINEYTEEVTFNEGIETVTINEDTEAVTFNEDIETVTINEDIETLIINEDPEGVTFNEDIEMLKSNENIETVIINDDMETETTNEEQPAYQSGEKGTLLNEENIDEYIIEYGEHDPDITEILVSQPDTVENIDLTEATIIASVPPTYNTSNHNPVTLSVVPPEIEFTKSLKTLKTYSKNNDTSAKFSICPHTDTNKKKPAAVTSSKELTSKIQQGLKRIIKKSEGNLLLWNEKDKPNT